MTTTATKHWEGYPVLTNSEIAQLTAEIHRLRAKNGELRTVLARAQALRGDLLAQLSYVPECVLDFCNRARAALQRAKQ